MFSSHKGNIEVGGIIKINCLFSDRQLGVMGWIEPESREVTQWSLCKGQMYISRGR